MSKVETSKQKPKRYFVKKHGNKKFSLDVNLKGFLCSCNNREKDCIRESYNLLNQYADKLYSNVSTEQTDEEDIGAALAKEISDLQQDNTPKNKRFQAIESGAKNFLFIRTNLDNPVELAEAIVSDIHETGSQKTRFLLRLVPVEVTCRATSSDIAKAFGPLAEKYFKDAPTTFSVNFNHRNNNSVSKDEVVKLLAEKVFEMRPDHKVDLKGASASVIVEVIKGFAFLSVVPNYFKYKKYNLLSIPEQQAKVE